MIFGSDVQGASRRVGTPLRGGHETQDVVGADLRVRPRPPNESHPKPETKPPSPLGAPEPGVEEVPEGVAEHV